MTVTGELAYLDVMVSDSLPILARRLGPMAPDGTAVWRLALGITGPVTLPIRFGGAR